MKVRTPPPVRTPLDNLKEILLQADALAETNFPVEKQVQRNFTETRFENRFSQIFDEADRLKISGEVRRLETSEGSSMAAPVLQSIAEKIQSNVFPPHIQELDQFLQAYKKTRFAKRA